MASRKPSAKAKKLAQFNAALDDGLGFENLDVYAAFDDKFARERERTQRNEAERAGKRRARACDSKNRYASQWEAEQAADACAAHGAPALNVYRCQYCNGWHLTSKTYL